MNPNRFHFLLRYDPGAGLRENSRATYSDSRVCLEAVGLHPQARVHRSGDTVVIILGNPIVGSRRNDAPVVEAFNKAPTDQDFARTLNGSFLIFLYDRVGGALRIINDRFASLAFYYAHGADGLTGALSFKQLFDRLRLTEKVAIDSEAIFEFLYFRRLLGEKTFEQGSRYLTSAAILHMGPDGGPSVEKYWLPDYGSPRPRGRTLVDELAGRLEAAVAMHMSDDRRFGLMLSGGLDSRAILAAAPRPPVCVTTCLTQNNESEVATLVAAAASARHYFIERPPTLYDQVLDDCVFLTGGMQIFAEAQFMGYGPRLTPLADTLLMGLVLDVFFGGLYLPKKPVTVFGRPALHFRLAPLTSDLVGDFMTGVSYRLKTSDPYVVVRPRMRRRLADYLRVSTEEIMDRGRDLGASEYDLWEYMHLHNLSRHYSFPMMSSIRTFSDCRSPALENDLFDLAIAMTAEDKVNGTPYQRAIAKLNPRLMAIRNANTNVSAQYPLPLQTCIKMVRFAASRVLALPFRPAPGAGDRSWPSPKETIAATPQLRVAINGLPRSQRLADLEFLDMTAVGRVVEEHENGYHDHAVLLGLLTTLDRFLDEPNVADHSTVFSEKFS